MAHWNDMQVMPKATSKPNNQSIPYLKFIISNLDLFEHINTLK